MEPYWQEGRVTIYCGDCREILPTLAPRSFDSIVTDPPYELGFMGKKWDSSGVAFDVRVWKECLRTLKPGGHLLAFGGTRTYHRLACAIEDAGFEIRDQVDWIYGSGFPKSLDVSKAIDHLKGAVRTEGARLWSGGLRSGATLGGGTKFVGSGTTTLVKYDTPATSEAEEWDGWGTGLKPAHEPICLARKPLEGTVAANVLKWGVGGLNIDGGRIAGAKGDGVWGSSNDRCQDGRIFNASPNGAEYRSRKHPEGRWPANVLFDEPAAEMLDDQSGVLTSGKAFIGQGGRVTQGNVYGEYKDGRHVVSCYADSGGASRFFYVAKAPQSERWFYCLDCQGAFRPSEREDHWHGHVNEKGEKSWKHLESHPTQKPEGLMRYLVRLVTPPGGRVLDPFTGSGSTLVAAEAEGFDSTGTELGAHNCEIARRRLAG